MNKNYAAFLLLYLTSFFVYSNNKPIANNDSYCISKNTALNPLPTLLNNDTDLDMDPLSSIIGTNASNGFAVVNADGTFLYTPNNGFVGTDAFTYYAYDGTDSSLIPATVTIYVNETTVTVGGALTFCAGGSVNLTAPNANAWLWNTSPTSQTINVTSSGNYFARLTFSNGCIDSSETITVTVNPLPSVSVIFSPNSYCQTSTSYLLNGGTPAGGSYSGAGVSGGQFTPLTAGVGTHTITYSYTDGNGCANSAADQITVSADLTNPVITGSGSNINLNTNPGLCTAVYSWSPPTASDDCKLQSFTSNYNSGTAFPVGTTVVTYTAYDAAGNSASLNYLNITVTDNEDPVVSNVPSDINTSSSSGACGANVSWSPPTATDNCGVTGITSNFNPGDFFSVGTTLVSYTFSDNAGNSVLVSFNVIVTDNTVPVISNSPGNISVSNNANQCGAVVSWTAPSASDNCSVQSFTSSHTPGSFFNIGTTIVTYTATDVKGNSTQLSFNVTVSDTSKPAFTGVPSPIGVFVAAGQCSNVVSWTPPSVSDNCGIASVVSSHNSGATFPVGTTVVTYTATDVNGNIKNVSFNVTVVDNIYPSISGKPNNLTSPNTPGMCGANISWGTVTASDNCPSVNLSTTHASGSFFPIGVTTVTYTATDASGNITTSSFTITINDVEYPVISGCPGNMVVCENDIVSFNMPTFTDNCPGSTMQQTSGLPSGSVFPVGVSNVIFAVTDASGNTSNCVFTVTVNAAPVVALTASDDSVCHNGSSINLNGTPLNGIYTGVGVSGNVFDPSIAGAGTQMVYYTFTDANSCTVTDSVEIVVLPGPAIVFNSLNDMCILAQPVSLNATPAGGTYTGPGLIGTTFHPSIAGLGQHTVLYSVTDIFNCTNVDSNVFLVYIKPPVNLGLDTNLCGGTLLLNAGNPGAAYSWNTGATTQQITVANSGTYFVNVSDANSCSNTDTINVKVFTPPVVSLGSFNNVCINATPFSLTGGLPLGGTYSGSGVSSNLFTASVAGAGTHTILYTFSDTNGCSGSASSSIYVDLCTVVANSENVISVLVYPNPTSGYVTISLSALPENGKWMLMDVSGKLLQSNTIDMQNQIVSFENLDNGIYFLCVLSGQKIIATSKVILSK